MSQDTTSYKRRPVHVVKRTLKGRNNLCLREDACSCCGEYRCPDHIHLPIQGNEADEENGAFFINPSNLDELQCFLCMNSPQRATKCTEKEYEKEYEDATKKLTEELTSSRNRRKVSLLLISRFIKAIQQIDLLDQSPLEQRLWAEMLARRLDRYYDPQVELFDNDGHYIVRSDFASALLRIALFCDVEKYHSSPEAKKRDAIHNQKLHEFGWVVKRYRTSGIVDGIYNAIDDIFQTNCERILELHTSGFNQ